MTTCAWDGKMLIADTRVSFVENGVLKAVDDVVQTKIFEAPHLTLNGKQVQVVAYSGAIEIAHLAHAIIFDETDSRDMSEVRFYKQFASMFEKYVGGFIVVLEDSVNVIQVATIDGDTSVQWQQFARNQTVVIGSAIQKLFKYAPQSTLARLDAYKLVRMASFLDDATGGDFHVWTENDFCLVRPPCGLKQKWGILLVKLIGPLFVRYEKHTIANSQRKLAV
jgi:hypothetical protein